MSNKKIFRLFISSTFNDFRREREVLQTKVFPHIKEYASKQGYTFQPIDLRWGVSNEAQLDQKTLELCLSEVRACKTNLYPNFLIMIGDRYGWIPLPYAIEEKEFKTIISYYEDIDKYDHYKVYFAKSKLKALKEWYKLDNNQLPASYILKERSEEYKEFEKWGAVESTLRTILQEAVKNSKLNEEQKRKYFLSATEAEVEEGIIPYIKPTPFHEKELLSKDKSLLRVDPKHIFGFFRDIDTTTQIENKFIQDDYGEAQDFKKRVSQELIEANKLHVKTTQTDKETLEETYLEEFQERTIKFLEAQIDIQKEKDAKDKLTPLQIELQAQSYFASNKCKDFLETQQLKELLANIETYISDDTQEPFVIYGASGRGKSSFMAKAIEKAKETLTKKVIYRFVGATPNSGSSKEILVSMFDELGIDVRSEDKEESFDKFSKRIKKYFMSLKEDITLFIDAIDQLQNDDQFLWLPNNLPLNVKIIISALEDEKYKDDTKYYTYLKTITTNKQEIPAFTQPKELLLALLEKENRTLTQEQETYFLKQFTSAQSPLYVSVAAQEIKNWKSTYKLDGQDLALTNKGIIQEFVNNLSEVFHHNKVFVQKVLGYIYASRDGLSESELLQLLDTDKEFVKLMADEEFHKNHTLELPLVHWSRLQTQLKPFLSLKTQDGEELMYFFHREFEDVVREQINQEKTHTSLIKMSFESYKNNLDNRVIEKKYISRSIYHYILYQDDKKLEEFAGYIAFYKGLQHPALIVDENEHHSKDEKIAGEKFRLFFMKYFYDQKENVDIDHIGAKIFYELCMSRLSVLLNSVGKVTEAKQLSLSVLDGKKKILNEERPKDYVYAVNNYATSLIREGKFREAIIEIENVLPHAKKLVDIGDYEAQYLNATLRTNLANAYYEQDEKNLSKTINLLNEALSFLNDKFYARLNISDRGGFRVYLSILIDLANYYALQNDTCKEAFECIKKVWQSILLDKLTKYNDIVDIYIRMNEKYIFIYKNCQEESSDEKNKFEQILQHAKKGLDLIENEILESDFKFYTNSMLKFQFSIVEAMYILKAKEYDFELKKFMNLANNVEADNVQFAQYLMNQVIEFSNKQRNKDRYNFLQELSKKDILCRNEVVKVLFLCEEEKEMNFEELLLVNGFRDTPHDSIIVKSEYKMQAELLLGVNFEIPSLIFYFEGEIEKVFPINSKVLLAIFDDLLYLSKFIAQVNKEDEISINSFVNAFGFIEFNEGAKQIFSQIVDIEDLNIHEGAEQYIEQVKTTQKILYSDELKGVVTQLREIFGENSIGKLR